MLKIAIIDTIGLTYDGDTLNKRGLGGSESAVILISKELAKLGFEVTVYNNCIDSEATPGIYDGVEFIDHEQEDRFKDYHDIVISSRSIFPFFAGSIYKFIPQAKRKILWMHDTFCQGDEHIEPMLLQGIIDEVFTLSDFHTNYTLNNNHGNRRMFEVLKHRAFITRNGAVKHIETVDLKKKNRNHFVFNASVTKGLNPLLYNIWPVIKKQIPDAKLTVIGGYYRFRENAAPDDQENTMRKFASDPRYAELGVTFTGVISQAQIAMILTDAMYMMYPCEFPETFGISTLESLLYKTPSITNRFGALEEVAVDLACYKVDYPSVKNSLFPHIDEGQQTDNFIKMVLRAYNDTYLLQQKQNYCDVLDDIYSWATIAEQWRQHFYFKLGMFLPRDQFRSVQRINDKVARIFNRRFNNEEDRRCYTSYGSEQKIVVISPFYNAENYVRDCILSVAQQDYDNYEHILIDDVSTDNSYKVAHETINSLPNDIKTKFKLIQNKQNVGAIANQISAIENCNDDDIIVLLDGDDWLVNNNTLFHFYNDLYHQDAEFTYGSCWSIADNIPLIAQTYPKAIRDNKQYRSHLFNWNIPYTHLRTFRKRLSNTINIEKLQDENLAFLKAGADGGLFYELIEQANPDKIVAVKEIVYNYNDANPLNDYKVNSEEQSRNAKKVLEK